MAISGSDKNLRYRNLFSQVAKFQGMVLPPGFLWLEKWYVIPPVPMYLKWTFLGDYKSISTNHHELTINPRKSQYIIIIYIYWDLRGFMVSSWCLWRLDSGLLKKNGESFGFHRFHNRNWIMNTHEI